MRSNPLDLHPALQSNRTAQLCWALIAAMTVAVVFAAHPPFLPADFGTGNHLYSDNWQLIALLFLAFGRLAARSKHPQKRLIKRLRRDYGVNIKPTWKGAEKAGGYLSSAGMLILSYYHVEVFDTVIRFAELLLSV